MTDIPQPDAPTFTPSGSTVAGSFTPNTSDPSLRDVGIDLGRWIGSVLPGLDEALAEIGDGGWKTGTRDAVLRLVASELVHLYDNQEPDVDLIDGDDAARQARFYLARYAITRARAHVIRSDRA